MQAVEPLKVADPQHQVGDVPGPGLHLQAHELRRRHQHALQGQGAASLAQILQAALHFALQPLQHVVSCGQEVAAATCWVQHFHMGQVALEVVEHVAGLGLVGLCGFSTEQRHGFGLGQLPICAEGFLQGRPQQALHVSPGGVVGAQTVALPGVQGTLQQGAEDAGIHLSPIEGGGLRQPGDLVCVQVQGQAFGEQASVEAQHLEGPPEPAGVHGVP